MTRIYSFAAGPAELPEPVLEQASPEIQAKQIGLVELKGRRAVGGMRASIYNATPLEGIKALVGFMGSFQVRTAKSHG